jgi:hypothetical protein
MMSKKISVNNEDEKVADNKYFTSIIPGVSYFTKKTEITSCKQAHTNEHTSNVPVRTEEEKEKIKRMIKKIKEKGSNYIPIVINIETVDNKFIKKGYIIRSNNNISTLLNEIKRDKELIGNEFSATFLFVGNKFIKLNDNLARIYDMYKSDDEILYLTLLRENTFG